MLSTEPNFEAGEVFLIDKPATWSSFDVVKKLKFALKVKKIGHAGTLDPMATGLLILCTGKKTKTIDAYQAQVKEYTCTMKFGATTASYDAESPEIEHFPIDNLQENQIQLALQQFTGEIQQLAPMYSAVKVEGKRLYELARKGKEVERQPRTVHVYSFELTRFALPEVDFKIVCSKGTYIRSLAHDLGKSLQNGAYLTALRRTKIGDFKVEDAYSIETFVRTFGVQKADRIERSTTDSNTGS